MRNVIAILFVAIGCGNSAPPPPPDGRAQIEIEVGADGYHPGEATAAAGQPVRLLFTRTSDQGCGQQLVFPEQNIRRDLPLDQAVPVDITMPASGTVHFTCGMGMYQGSIVAR